jgi:hypothetical protein
MGKVANIMVSPPDGREYHGSTEIWWSLTFNDKLQVRKITGGYVVDQFDEEASMGGCGLSLGILSSIGIPFPTAPGDPLLRLVLQWLVEGMFDGPGGLFPKSKSESVPEWWTRTNVEQIHDCILFRDEWDDRARCIHWSAMTMPWILLHTNCTSAGVKPRK